MLEIAHAKISRAHGGLATPKNLILLCQTHHRMLDSGRAKEQMIIRNMVDEYMFSLYGEIKKDEVTFKKWK